MLGFCAQSVIYHCTAHDATCLLCFIAMEDFGLQNMKFRIMCGTIFCSKCVISGLEKKGMYLSSTLSIFSVSESFLFSSSLRCLSLSRSLSRSRSASLSLSLSRARCLSSSFRLSSSSSWSSSSSFFTSMLSLVVSSRIRTPASPL